jgi:hypothetical protein
MAMTNFPQEVKKFEIEAYRRPKNSRELKTTHVPFSGAPLKHPHDAEKVILVPDPYSSRTTYYEFKGSDISFVETLPSVVDQNGKAFTMVRIWVKKMSVGILCAPFLVEETKR